MKVTIAKSYAETNDPRATLIECIVIKLCNLDLDVLRKVHEAIAKVLDEMRKPIDD